MGAEVRRGNLPKESRMPLLLVLLGAEFAKLSNFGRFRLVWGIFRTSDTPKGDHPNDLTNSLTFFLVEHVNFFELSQKKETHYPGKYSCNLNISNIYFIDLF